LNREPWGKAPWQHTSILNKKGTSTYNRPNKKLGKQRTEKEAKRPKDQKAKKANKTEISKQLQGLQPEQDGRMKTCFDPNEMF
jgi:hypothetical protein